METVDAVTTIWGAQRVGVRIFPTNPFNDMYDSNPDVTFGYVAERLGKLGLAYLHVVEADEYGKTTGHKVDFRRLRDLFGGTYITKRRIRL